MPVHLCVLALEESNFLGLGMKNVLGRLLLVLTHVAFSWWQCDIYTNKSKYIWHFWILLVYKHLSVLDSYQVYLTTNTCMHCRVMYSIGAPNLFKINK